MIYHLVRETRTLLLSRRRALKDLPSRRCRTIPSLENHPVATTTPLADTAATPPQAGGELRMPLLLWQEESSDPAKPGGQIRDAGMGGVCDQGPSTNILPQSRKVIASKMLGGRITTFLSKVGPVTSTYAPGLVKKFRQ